MNTKIAVIDVETPNGNNNTICSIGVVAMDENGIVNEFYSLVNPESGFDERNIVIHGITPDMAADAPLFPDIWHMLEPYFTEYLVIGHNVRFDLSCIRKMISRYHLSALNPYFVDTLDLSRDFVEDTDNHKLDTLCRHFDISLENHHNALCDCRATYALFHSLTTVYDIPVERYIHAYDFGKQDRQNFKKNPRYCETTKYLQELQGILLGVMSDDELNDREILTVNYWVNTHLDLAGNYPFDKVYSTLEKVLEDNVITEEERSELFSLFDAIIKPVETDSQIVLDGNIQGKTVCLTGDFDCMSRKELENFLSEQGAVIKKSVVKKLDYLVVGNQGSDLWIQGNYGTKIKKAMELNEKGCDITIIKENDFMKIFEI